MQWKQTQTSIHEDTVSLPGPWVKDPVLLWLWCRPAAVLLIQSLALAWERLYAAGVALKSKK